MYANGAKWTRDNNLFHTCNAHARTDLLLRKTCTAVGPCLGDQSGNPGSNSYDLDVRRSGRRPHAPGPSAPLSRRDGFRRFLLRELRQSGQSVVAITTHLVLKGASLRMRRARIESHVSQPKSPSIRRRRSWMASGASCTTEQQMLTARERRMVSSCTSTGCGIGPRPLPTPPSLCCLKPASHLAEAGTQPPSARLSSSPR